MPTKKPATKKSTADKLATPSKKSDVELKEDDLKRVTGGMGWDVKYKET